MKSLFQAALKDIVWRNQHPEVKKQECITNKGAQWRAQCAARWERDGLPDPVPVKPEGVRYFAPAPVVDGDNGGSGSSAPKLFAHNFRVGSTVRHKISGDIGEVQGHADLYGTTVNVLWTQGQKVETVGKVAAFDLDSVGERTAELYQSRPYVKDPGFFSATLAYLKNVAKHHIEASALLEEGRLDVRGETNWRDVLEHTTSVLDVAVAIYLKFLSSTFALMPGSFRRAAAYAFALVATLPPQEPEEE